VEKIVLPLSPSRHGKYMDQGGKEGFFLNEVFFTASTNSPIKYRRLQAAPTALQMIEHHTAAEIHSKNEGFKERSPPCLARDLDRRRESYGF
jgi:hypothetical protein